jgi:hypothetical protein
MHSYEMLDGSRVISSPFHRKATPIIYYITITNFNTTIAYLRMTEILMDNHHFARSAHQETDCRFNYKKYREIINHRI